MKRVASHVTLLALLVLATAGMVMQTGSVPHVHAAPQTGLYNQEHDLTLLAGLAAHVVPVDAAPAPTLDAVSTQLVPLEPERPPVRVALSGDSRAPPVR
jgi:hypothetical protein